MKHLNREEMTEFAVGERPGRELREHTEGCRECAGEMAALRGDLEAAAQLVDGAVRERDAAWAERMWERVRPELEAWEPRRRGWLAAGWRPRMAWATAAATAMLAVGFVAGRAWEHGQARPVAAVNRTAAAAAPAAATPVTTPAENVRPVVVLVLADHLDRSERLLVQLKHADCAAEETAPALREEARSLLEANRVARERAATENDPELKATLGRLDSILEPIAKHPDGMTAEELTRMGEEMNAAGLLFEVRVLRARIPGGKSGKKSREAGDEI